MRPLTRKVLILLAISFCFVGLYAKYVKPITCSGYYGTCWHPRGLCAKGKCYCSGLYIGDGQSICRKMNSCPKDAKCQPHAKCVVDPKKPQNHLCVCKPGYWENEDGDCLVSCLKNSDCKPQYSICTKKKKMCGCDAELILTEKSCEPAPLHKCKMDTDCHRKAKCERGKCHCQGLYVGNGKNCREGKPCSEKMLKKGNCPSQSTCVVDPVRVVHPICICDPGLHEAKDGPNTKCVECLSDVHDEQCKKKYSVCRDQKCTCRDELILGETACEAAPLHACQADTDCNSRAKCVEGKCICQGNTIGNGEYCRDTQACTSEHQCGQNMVCVVDPLLPDQQHCWCAEGFVKPVEGTDCQDVDECSNSGTCPENSVCKNTEGSYECICNDGYKKNDNGICEDEDECSEMPDACGAGERCVNKPGEYSCECDTGYVKKGNACVKKDECDQCKKHEVCVHGKCKCKKGYRKNKRGHCEKKISDGLLAGSGDSIQVSSFLSALIVGMLWRLAFTA